jgi:hypothetical protein
LIRSLLAVLKQVLNPHRTGGSRIEKALLILEASFFQIFFSKEAHFKNVQRLGGAAGPTGADLVARAV